MKFKLYKTVLLVIAFTMGNASILQAKNNGYLLTAKVSQNNVKSDVEKAIINGVNTPGQAKPIPVISAEPSISSSNHSIGLALSKTLRMSQFSLFNIPLSDKKLDSLFVNYGIFYDHLKYNNFANNKYNLTINSRYGVNASLGHDINEKFSIYYGLSYASVDYEVDSRSIAFAGGNNGTENNRKTSPINSLGLSYKLSGGFQLALEYSRQKIELEASTYSSITDETQVLEEYNFDTEIESFSFNVSKRF